jgi:hypothetical protein
LEAVLEGYSDGIQRWQLEVKRDSADVPTFAREWIIGHGFHGSCLLKTAV